MPQPAAAPDGFWDRLSDVERAALTRVGRLRTYSPAATLMHQGDPPTDVLVIVSGWVKVVAVTAHGHEVFLAVRGAGDLIGEAGVLNGGPRSATVCALEAVRVLAVPSVSFGRFLEDHAHVSRVLAQMMSARMGEADRRMAVQLTTGSEERLAVLLLELAYRYGSPDPGGGIRIAVPLSQRELASCVGTTRETVARCLRRWRDKGLVATGWRTIRMLDITALEQISTIIS